MKKRAVLCARPGDFRLDRMQIFLGNAGVRPEEALVVDRHEEKPRNHSIQGAWIRRQSQTISKPPAGAS